MASKSYIIYRHINKKTGQIYIGQTCQNPIARWKKDGSGYKTCSRFWEAIQKYGWDNFSHQILYKNLSAQEADQIEIKLIQRYDATNPQKGYNINLGGSHLSEETKNKISLSNKGKKRTLEQIEKNKQMVTQLWKNAQYRNKNLAARSFYQDEKFRQKMKESKRKSFEEHPEYKEKIRNAVIQKVGCPVQCIETGQIFKCQTEAAKWAGLKNSSGISACCLGRQKTAGKYHWRFYKGEK